MGHEHLDRDRGVLHQLVGVGRRRAAETRVRAAEEHAGPGQGLPPDGPVVRHEDTRCQSLPTLLVDEAPQGVAGQVEAQHLLPREDVCLGVGEPEQGRARLSVVLHRSMLDPATCPDPVLHSPAWVRPTTERIRPRLTGHIRSDQRESRRRSHQRAARAAFMPQAPWTLPPGWAEAEAR